jgi:hypothetical protein
MVQEVLLAGGAVDTRGIESEEQPHGRRVVTTEQGWSFVVADPATGEGNSARRSGRQERDSGQRLAGGRITADGWQRDIRLPGVPWVISAQVMLVDGRPQLLGLHLDPLENDEYTASDWVLRAERLRRLPLSRILAAAWAQRRLDFGAALREQVLTRPVGQPWPEAHYVHVARVYVNAVAAGEPPLKAITELWVTSRANASKWLAEARRRGLLGYPDRPGVAGSGSKVSPVRRAPQRRKVRK